MTEELLEIYTERLKNYDASLVSPEVRAYFGALCGMLAGEKKASPLPDSGEEDPVLRCWYAEAGRLMREKERKTTPGALCRGMETSIRLLCAFEEAWAEGGMRAEEKVVRDIIWSYLHDYAEEFTTEYLDGISAGDVLFIMGDPFWTDPRSLCEEDRKHAGDLALFWGDRLMARKLETLKKAAAGRNAGQIAVPAAKTDPAVIPKEFSGRLRNSVIDYMEKAAQIVYEIS